MCESDKGFGCGKYNDTEWRFFYKGNLSKLKNKSMQEHLDSCEKCQAEYEEAKKRYHKIYFPDTAKQQATE